jgi:hypothetical protein
MYFTTPVWNGRPFCRPIDTHCQRTLADCLREVRRYPERSVFRSTDEVLVVCGYSRAPRRNGDGDIDCYA